MTTPLRARLAAACCALLALACAGSARADERVDLRPETAGRTRLARLVDALRPASTRAPRVLRIETSPLGAELELFYARAGVQLRHARGRAPLESILPSLAETQSGDFLTVAARFPGRRPAELVTPAEKLGATLTLELTPLQSRVVGVWLLDLAGRARLTLQSEGPLDARIAATARGWRVVAASAALSERAAAALRGMRGRTLRSVEARALGDDLVIELEAEPARAAGAELRATSAAERVRPLHHYALDIIPPGGGSENARALRAALGQLAARDVAGCAAEFDRALRAALDPAALARAFSHRDATLEWLAAESLRRLAELAADGSVHLLEGSRLEPGRPLELERALAQPEQVLGLLAALRAVVARVEPEPERTRAFAALVAPELPFAEFETLRALAERAELRCASNP